MNEDKLKQNISKALKTKLIEHDLTQKELSKIIGVDNSTVGKWLSETTIPRMGPIQKMADYFKVPKSYFLEDKSYDMNSPNISNNINTEINKYKYFDIGIAAGLLESIESKTNPDDYIELSNKIMGKYAGKESIIVLRLNGESMNKIIPNGSYIIVDTEKKSVTDINNRDIVVFSENGEYSVKKYYNDTINERFLFIPQSYEEIFTPIEVKYENSSNLKLIGKVVKYIVELN